MFVSLLLQLGSQLLNRSLSIGVRKSPIRCAPGIYIATALPCCFLSRTSRSAIMAMNSLLHLQL